MGTLRGQVGNATAGGTASLEKLPTGILGLDDVLEGGLPAQRTTLIGGGPGAGKSVLALELAYRSALAGRPSVYVTFEETAEALRRNAASLGWDLASLERDGKLFLLQADVSREMVASGEFNIGGLLSVLGGKSDELGAACIALDAVDVLLGVFADPGRERHELYGLHDWLRQRGATAVLTVKVLEEGGLQYPFLDFLADCILRLDQRVEGQVTTRRLWVRKYRGSGYIANECPFVIEGGRGFVVMPVPSMTLADRALRERVSTGNAALDAHTGGGLWRGSCVLVAGASGTGKTTLAATFALAAGARGERVLYVSYEESAEQLIGAMRSVGLDLQRAQDAGGLRLLPLMPESLGVEAHLRAVIRAIEEFAAAHLVIDAISGCWRMGSTRAAFDFLVRLLTHCKAAGITCLFINQMTTALEQPDASGFGITSLVDTLMQLNLEPAETTRHRTLAIVKSRGTAHSQAEHRFAITDHGIDLAGWRGEGQGA